MPSISHSLIHSMENTATQSARIRPPWHVERNGIETFITNEEGWRIAEIVHAHTFVPDNPEEHAAALLLAASPDLRQASQELYDRLQEYLDVSDDELIAQGHEGLVEAMDAIEAAWRKADGTVPEQHHEQAA